MVTDWQPLSLYNNELTPVPPTVITKEFTSVFRKEVASTHNRFYWREQKYETIFFKCDNVTTVIQTFFTRCLWVREARRVFLGSPGRIYNNISFYDGGEFYDHITLVMIFVLRPWFNRIT